MRRFRFPILLALCLAVFPSSGPASSCGPARDEFSVLATPPAHVLTGAWLATDGTLFIFQKDGTFHGYDFHQQEIWGHWTVVSPSEIDFQSVRRDGAYRPQHAVVDLTDRNTMDYFFVKGRPSIKATRLPVKQAEAKWKEMVPPPTHQPGEAKEK